MHDTLALELEFSLGGVQGWISFSWAVCINIEIKKKFLNIQNLLLHPKFKRAYDSGLERTVQVSFQALNTWRSAMKAICCIFIGCSWLGH
jgi:hypothetical protein